MFMICYTMLCKYCRIRFLGWGRDSMFDFVGYVLMSFCPPPKKKLFYTEHSVRPKKQGVR